MISDPSYPGNLASVVQNGHVRHFLQGELAIMFGQVSIRKLYFLSTMILTMNCFGCVASNSSFANDSEADIIGMLSTTANALS